MFWSYAVGTSNMFGGVSSASYVFSNEVSEDLKACFTYNFDSTATDETGRYDATTVNATYTNSGKLDSGYTFNGSTNYIIIPPSDDWDIDGDFSVSAWINPTDNNATRVIFYIGGYQSGGRWKFWSLNINSSDVIIFEGEGDGSSSRSNAVSNETITHGSWNHICCSWNSSTSTASLYLNGSEVTYASQTTGLSGTVHGNTRVYMGAQYRSTLESEFYGTIDEVKMFDRQLTGTDVTTLHNSGDGIRAKNYFESNPDLTDNLIFYCPLNGTSAVDEAGGAATTANGALVASAGVVDKCLTFLGDGSTNITLPHNDLFNFGATGDFSISAWFKTGRDSAQGNGYCGIVQRESTSAPWIYMQLVMKMHTTAGDRGKLQLLLGDGSSSSTTTLTTTQYNDDQWHHVLATRSSSGTNLKLYVDGVKVADDTITTRDIDLANRTMAIGNNRNLDTNNAFDGEIQDVGLWNSDVSASYEILYNSGVPLRLTAPFQGSSTLTTDLESAYSFKNDASDDYGDNDGTVNGATYITNAKVGNGYSFVTNDSIVSANNTSISGTDTRSFSVWANVASFVGNQVMMSIGEKANYKAFRLKFDTSGYLRLEVEGTGYTSSLQTTAGTWSHVAVTFSGTQMQDAILYLDGVSEAVTGTETLNTTASPLYLGRAENTTTYQYLNGSLAQPLVYPRVLTSGEVTELVNGGRGLYFY